MEPILPHYLTVRVGCVADSRGSHSNLCLSASSSRSGRVWRWTDLDGLEPRL